MSYKIDENQHRLVSNVSRISNIDKQELTIKFESACLNFFNWYHSALKIFARNPCLKKVYLTSWYFPDMMAVCAAAKKYSVETIEIQHGKQGKYQAMYSGWNSIPEEGYDLMPTQFWCWGEPSCKHILLSSPERKRHKPFVGGLPWIDYYKKVLSIGSAGSGEEKAKNILLTLQPNDAVGQSFPNFLHSWLQSNQWDGHLIIRSHQNDLMSKSYLGNRLKGIDSNLYTISNEMNLYDQLKSVTHHVTAFSSCCYEAEYFNVPTLLFGDEGKVTYTEEINNGRFSWIDDSDVKSFEKWLGNSDNFQGPKTTDPYIISSLELAKNLVS